ncbi:MAG: nucleoside hydrolase [Candidatus Nitrosocaldaceae archaeon]
MIIMDMDPGIDDAIALILALRAGKVDAITTVYGNVEVEQSSINALKILDALNYDIPVYKGASKPLIREAVYAKEIHGYDGIGESNLYTNRVPLPIKMIKLDNHTIIATGPLTNLINSNARFYIMGGIYNHKQKGNITCDAEFNFYSDPEAADLVLKKDVVACGLDLTLEPKCVIDHDFMDILYAINTPSARLAYKILKYPINKFGLFHLHDVFALFAYIAEDIFEYKRLKVRMDNTKRGKCLIEEGGNVKVCISIDTEAFKKLLLELLK